MTVLGETARKVGRYFDLKADEYDARMASPYHRLLREITWQHVRRMLPRETAEPVLDAGGATGYWSIRLARAGYRAVLLDVSDGMLEVARRKVEEAGVSAKVEIIQGDITDLREFHEESFGAVLAVEGPLSFSSDPEMALAEMALVTRPGGMVAVSVLNRFKAGEFDKFLRKGDIEGLERFLASGRSVKSVPGPGRSVDARAFAAEETAEHLLANGLEVATAIGKPIFAKAVAAKLGDSEVFSRVLAMEVEHNANRSLWGNADVLEFVAVKP